MNLLKNTPLAILTLCIGLVAPIGAETVISTPDRANYPDTQFVIIEAEMDVPVEGLVVWNYHYESNAWKVLRPVYFPEPLSKIYDQYTVKQEPGWHCVVVVIGDYVSDPIYVSR